ncbi:SulP family inorganic anion transporter [Streptomyces sp. NPDC059256]|uniref:SulP family inorganic anion transporter n=1 Tax=Streptomyces sp. NPDC059256 TaxID=3346794 RepID=UPI003678D386
MSSERTRPGTGRHAKRSAGGRAKKSPPSPGLTNSIGTDFVASVVVFLVALPLCIGVAAASGVSVSLGIISGIVGGLIVGFLPGSTFQVSGPAAGLAVLVLEFTTEHGVELLGPVVLISGLLQMALGMMKMGRLFQSISLAVVQGMLAGIGLPLILSQTYALVDSQQLGAALKNLAGLPDLATDVLSDGQKGGALLLGGLTVVLCFLWKKVPAPLGRVPAPLVAVVLGSLAAALPMFDVKKVVVDDMLDAIDVVGPTDLGGLLDPAVLMMIVTFTIIASAESLFSAAAVDRMHTGARTQYNKELFSQGVGNTVCGLLGALPMTAVIVRSAVNVQAGGKTKISRVLHGAWLLGFGLLLPGLLGLIPVTVLAGILLHAGWKLFNPPAFVQMWKADRGEGIVMFITTLAIVVANLLEGVLAGLAVAIVLTVLRMSTMTIRRSTEGDFARLELRGNATFLRLTRLIDALESVSGASRVEIDARGIVHLDMACLSEIEGWAEQRRKAGAEHVSVRLRGDQSAQEAAESAVARAQIDPEQSATAHSEAIAAHPHGAESEPVPQLAARGYVHGTYVHGTVHPADPPQPQPQHDHNGSHHHGGRPYVHGAPIEVEGELADGLRPVQPMFDEPAYYQPWYSGPVVDSRQWDGTGDPPFHPYDEGHFR